LPRLGIARRQSHLLSHRLDRCDVPADQRQARTFGRERPGNRRTHSLGRAGDDGDLSLELEVHKSLLLLRADGC
jgi:hypothetical protein